MLSRGGFSIEEEARQHRICQKLDEVRGRRRAQYEAHRQSVVLRGLCNAEITLVGFGFSRVER